MRAEVPTLILALAAALLLATACGQNLASKPASSEEASSKESEDVASPSPPESSAPLADSTVAETTSPCAGGAVKDDGSVETGYGYVPSATMGQYVQEFRSRELKSRELAKVCVCWLRSRGDDEIDFEVVFFEQEGERPAAQAYARVPATATEVPKGVPAAGRLYEVDVSGVSIPEGTSYIGVRWDPSADDLFFVCTNTSKKTKRVNVFSAEDRSPAWTNVKDSPDPIFKRHRSILVRAAAAD